MVKFDKDIFPSIEDSEFWTISKTIARNDFVDLPDLLVIRKFKKTSIIKIGEYLRK